MKTREIRSRILWREKGQKKGVGEKGEGSECGKTKSCMHKNVNMNPIILFAS